MRFLLGSALALTLLSGVILLDFVHRSTVFAVSSELPNTAVVFTGQIDRVDRGLALQAAGDVQLLFISGVNRRAGIFAEGFADQFNLPAEQVAALETGRIVLATGADTTLENAVETACWLGRQDEMDAIALVTSPWHMARASRALDRALSGIRVVRVASTPSQPSNRRGTTEFVKFAVTWLITVLPRGVWPVDRDRLCVTPL